jgi:predicted nucleic acid-binding protein
VIVVDASAVVAVLIAEPPVPGLRERLAADEDLHAPHLVDLEVANAVRRLVARGLLTADRAADALLDHAELSITRYPHLPLLDRVWELRGNLTPYDAVYVALAEALGVALLTTDSRLTSATAHGAAVELYPPVG